MWLWNQHIMTHSDCDVPHDVDIYEQSYLVGSEPLLKPLCLLKSKIYYPIRMAVLVKNINMREKYNVSIVSLNSQQCLYCHIPSKTT